MGLGLVHLHLGELDAAEGCVEFAEPLATSDHRRVKLLWLRASICRKRGRRSEAEILLREVVEIFRGIHHGEAALSACELVGVVLEQGKPAEAARICRSLRPLLEPLRQNRIVDAAMGELVRAGANGSLSLDLVWRIKAAIGAERNNARTRREWRALATAG